MDEIEKLCHNEEKNNKKLESVKENEIIMFYDEKKMDGKKQDMKYIGKDVEKGIVEKKNIG
jgi:glycyl-tRNA synthetase (class II)